MRQPSLMSIADPEWVGVLRAEAEKPGRTKQAIADELGVSRTAISLICAGKYSAGMDKVQAKIASRVLSLYAGGVWCPHLHSALSGGACEEHRSAPMTMSDPGRLRQWAACRSCPQNPMQQSEVKDAV
ncbi:helix-turn-helix domain-containing protein [Rhizobium cremeum]|uniref:helix-turn-helix domain-containing protein n=1 Tax=Rhizobium cremeum TaxID=2813827 RepID=UPI001FD07552|nr:helix-turn-helix transcriptional regulator [Rhizobium cremeum]